MTFDLSAINMASSSRWLTKCCVLKFLVIFAIFGGDDTVMAVPRLEGFRPEKYEGHRMDKHDLSIIWGDSDVSLRLFGTGITRGTGLKLTMDNETAGAPCGDLQATKAFYIEDGLSESNAVVRINVKAPDTEGVLFRYTFCLKEGGSEYDGNTGNDPDDPDLPWTHQGSAKWLQIAVERKPVHKTLLPVWLQICFICLLLCFSGLFSGLNLGLMSLDQTELKIVESVGSTRERAYARRIRPIRKRGNYLLCTILLGNVLVNNTLAILMDDLTGSGFVAIIAATIGIVIFGEIIPQAVCSRYGLAIGANTLWFTMFFMVVTFPLSFPVSKLLDLILGEEIGAVYNRDRLRELLKVTQDTTDLKNDEVNIIAGALELSKKSVLDIMTSLEDVYMIEYDAVLDFETMSEIMKTGYTRIPVYEKDRTKIIALLNIKDLAFIDPDDRTALKTVCKFYNHPINFVFEDTKLDVMLEEFKKGRSHISFVQVVNNEGDGDPFYETLGLVTLEDVIEEIIQSEIVDETDTIIDNRRKTRRMDNTQVKDFSVFNQPDEQNFPRLTPQLALATFQYLSASVPTFKDELISANVLQRLIKQNVVFNLKVSDPTAPSAYVYTKGKTIDCFILILQGRVEVDIGKENMLFEGGPFMYFGVQALTDPLAETPLRFDDGRRDSNPELIKAPTGISHLTHLRGMSNSLSKYTSVSSISSTSESAYTKVSQYTPDFCVRALCDLQYLKIRRPHYIAARRATMMERQPKKLGADVDDDPFTREWHRATSMNPENHVALQLDSSHEDSKDNISGASPSADGGVRQRSMTQDSEPDGHIANAGTPLIASCEEISKRTEADC